MADEHDDVLHHGIVITWPKTRPFYSYLREVGNAKIQGRYCYYRIRGKPLLAYGAPCYHVWDGQIRGSMPTLGVEDVPDGVIEDPITREYWPAGTYLIRSPEWTPVKEPYGKLAGGSYGYDRDYWKMPGFRGWRYFDLEPEYI